MQKTTYDDYKYCMQDSSTLYVGTKFTLGELVMREDLLFKFCLVMERYILPEADREDTLETHLYYLPADSFLIRIYKRLNAKVKINLIEEKTSLTGKKTKKYVTKTISVDKLAAMSPEEKEKKGVVVSELSVSKLALMTF